MTDAELQTLAYTLLGEARGEGPEGMLAVANVIANRVDSPYYADDPVEVATQPYQFSTNNRGTGGNQAATRREVPVGSPLYNQALRIVQSAIVDRTAPRVTSSLFYHSDGINPNWSDSVTTGYGTRRIGNHVFYEREGMPALDIPSVLTALEGRPADTGLGIEGESFANQYTQNIDQAIDATEAQTPNQSFSFDRIADRDFYGIRNVIRDAGGGARRTAPARAAERIASVKQALAQRQADARGAAARQASLYQPGGATARGAPSYLWPTKSEIIVKSLAQSYPTPGARRGNPWTDFNTPLSTTDEKAFQAWKAQNAPDDSGEDYDLRGAFKAGLTRDGNGHMLDTFKKPNHPTFSVESQYAGFAPDRAGRWEGDQFIPPQQDAAARTPMFDGELVDKGLIDKGERITAGNPMAEPKQADYTDNLLPASAHIFLDSAVLGRKDAIRSTDFSKRELMALEAAVQTAEEDGRDWIGYQDYGKVDAGAVGGALTNPKQSVAASIGMARFKRENGKIVITDTYDFNTKPSSEAIQKAGGFVPWMLEKGPWIAAERLGQAALPEGQGRKVRVAWQPLLPRPSYGPDDRQAFNENIRKGRVALDEMMAAMREPSRENLTMTMVDGKMVYGTDRTITMPQGPQGRGGKRTPAPKLTPGTPDQARKSFTVGPDGKVVPRETMVGAGTAPQISRTVFPTPKMTPEQRSAIAADYALDSKTRVTESGLIVHIRPLVSIGPDGQPILIPDQQPASAASLSPKTGGLSPDERISQARKAVTITPTRPNYSPDDRNTRRLEASVPVPADPTPSVKEDPFKWLPPIIIPGVTVQQTTPKKYDGFNPQKLADGIAAEKRRLSGLPPLSPDLPRPDPRRSTSAPTIATELEAAASPFAGIPGLGGTINAFQQAQKVGMIPKPGKVSTSTVKPQPVAANDTGAIAVPTKAPSVPARRPNTPSKAKPTVGAAAGPAPTKVTRYSSKAKAFVAPSGYLYQMTGNGGRPQQIGYRRPAGETAAQQYERLAAPAAVTHTVMDTWNNSSFFAGVPQSLV